MKNKHKSIYRKASLLFYDAILLAIVNLIILGISPSSTVEFTLPIIILHYILAAGCIYLCRRLAHAYQQVWRYGSPSSYIRLMLADAGAGCVYFLMQMILTKIPFVSSLSGIRLTFIHTFAIVALNLLLTISIRLFYQFVYDYANCTPGLHGPFWRLIEIAGGFKITGEKEVTSPVPVNEKSKIRIAIVGAGHVGASLAEELIRNPQQSYLPVCFIDIDRSKIGREIAGITVLAETEATPEKLAEFQVQEIVFALPQITPECKKELYEHYKKTGCKIKVYDYPVMQMPENGKRHLREFDIEELLFRQPIEFHDEKTKAYYKDKVVLITGGGGSIGSELCRQIAKMQPKKLVILDVYENGAYDVQQELRIAYGGKISLQVEIVSVCDKKGLEVIIDKHRPDIVIHAAAHKHVPLMEHNVCEAVKNNVFGTLNTVELCEKYKVSRFMMVSTDKAVNPTNVMGATKRMCEMIVQSYARHHGGSDKPTTVYSATRFGNVLGSAGSVIPLFKKQIMNGGPVTVTDKRIIRYFMTIPEASQLVLQSGSMAKNGELFVLDMGKPVKILELAENMIRLSGFEPYRDIDIIETGLRPGEKLYEELLIRTEELDKTENSMIFIERDEALTMDELHEKLSMLRTAVETEDDETAKMALMAAVPTYHKPEEVNKEAGKAAEMKMVAAGVPAQEAVMA